MDRTRLISLGLLFYCGIGWGAAVAIAKIATTGGVHPLGYVFWVAIIAALILSGICVIRGTRPGLTGQHLRYYVIIGGLRIVCANVVWYTTVKYVPAGALAVVLGLTPIFTYAISLMMRLEHFAALRMAGLSLGLVGVVLFVVPGESLPDPSMIPWLLFGLLAPLTYSLANILIDRLRPATGNSLSLTTGMVWFGAAVMLPVSLLTGAFHVPSFPPSTPDIAVFGHAIISGFAFFALFEMIRLSGPTFASQLNYVVTLTGVLSGIAFFGEAPTWWVWAGTACVLSGVALVNKRQAANG
ncbi:MAG: drug/metabolite transporter (DMT)-like permease [Paracoccaceae bacterium]|jgi:drug/metabolite transporter (DMT)-like permease